MLYRDTYLHTPPFLIRRKPNAIISKVHFITRNPLARILPSLCSDHCDQSRSAQVKLQPLLLIILLSGPASLVPTASFVVYSAEPRSMVTIIGGGGGDVSIWNLAILDTDRNGIRG